MVVSNKRWSRRDEDLSHEKMVYVRGREIPQRYEEERFYKTVSLIPNGQGRERGENGRRGRLPGFQLD